MTTLLAKDAEALAPRPQNHLLMMSARVSLTPTFSCRAWN